MSVTVLVMTDGRLDCLTQTLPSLTTYLHGDVDEWVIHDDTGDPDHHATLRRHLPPTWRLITTPRRAGFAGAYRHAYEWLLAHTTSSYVFSTEDDFVLTRDVDLTEMAFVLSHRAGLAQLALRRQPWNDAERAAGGIVECHPHRYADYHDHHDNQWLEHRLFYTTNPSLIPRSVLASHPWPTVPGSEGVFSAGLFADPTTRSGFWGARTSGEWVQHIGAHRRGHGY